MCTHVFINHLFSISSLLFHYCSLRPVWMVLILNQVPALLAKTILGFHLFCGKTTGMVSAKTTRMVHGHITTKHSFNSFHLSHSPYLQIQNVIHQRTLIFLYNYLQYDRYVIFFVLHL